MKNEKNSYFDKLKIEASLRSGSVIGAEFKHFFNGCLRNEFLIFVDLKMDEKNFS